MEREYVSPFLLPSDRPQPKCNNPEHAKRWPNSHAKAGDPDHPRTLWGKECPVHGKTAYEERMRVHVENEAHDRWYQYREAFARGEDPKRNMSEMLRTVTLENPPDRPADIEVKLDLVIPLALTAGFAAVVMFVIAMACLLG